MDLIRGIFILIGFLNVLVSGYFIWRYILYRKIPSLVCAAGPFWGLLWALRELRWIHRSLASVFLFVALILAVFSVVVIVAYELDQPKPFR